jgi:hypothetical protein
MGSPLRFNTTGYVGKGAQFLSACRALNTEQARKSMEVYQVLITVQNRFIETHCTLTIHKREILLLCANPQRVEEQVPLIPRHLDA